MCIKQRYIWEFLTLRYKVLRKLLEYISLMGDIDFLY